MTLGIALLGSGIFAREFYLPVLARLDCSLKAVYSRSTTSARSAVQAATALGIPEPDLYADDSTRALADLLAREDIAAVVVALPIGAQPAAIRAVLVAGKHLLSEKPLAADSTIGAQLVAEYRQQFPRQIWRCAENWEVEDGYLAARSLLASGKIGRLHTFSLTATLYVDNENNKWFDTPWRAKPQHQGGFLLDAGVHNIALLRTILPSEKLESLSAFCSLNNEHIAPYDLLHATLKYSSGLTGRFTLDYGARGRPGSNVVEVSGSDGFLRIEDVSAGGVEYIRVTTYTGKFGTGGSTSEQFEKRGVENEVNRFIAACEGKADNFGRPEGALLDVRAIEACLNSHGSLVKLT
ncbi:hypothetical protein JCM6882_004363 [Rhodosporidiobolus microsporus]